MEKGDKVKFVGEPTLHTYGEIYTIERKHKKCTLYALEESKYSAYEHELEPVESTPENSDRINVKKVDEVHITIEETTHHLTRKEAIQLLEDIREALWS